MIGKSLKDRVVEMESQVLADLDVEKRLQKVVGTTEGMSLFAEAFYFIRYDFCKLNFIVGAKCPPHEKYWSGLVKNLLEELGGGMFKTHNQLYRDFLLETTGKKENMLAQPKFAQDFNEMWELYCKQNSYKHGLLAIGLYEALDNPDYQLLYTCVKYANVSDLGSKFFVVHANADHYEMFEDIIEEIDEGEDTKKLEEEVLCFVIETQKYMWESLLEWLEKNLTIALTRTA